MGPSPTDADVLLVEFDDSVRTTTAALLDRHGFSVAEADNGAMAFDLLNEKCFGLVLLGLDLPVLSGEELLSVLDDSAPPVVVHTMFPRQPSEKETFTHKIVEYIEKPVEPSVLVETVTRLLGERIGN